MDKNKIGTLLAIFFMTYSSLDAQGYYTTLYNNCKALKIEHVEYLNSGTCISICYEGIPYTPFTLSSSIYASDESCMRHQVIATEGIQLDKPLYLGDDGKAHFTLVFDPLPKGTRMFDIIECDFVGFLHIYGIHQEKDRMNIPPITEEANHEEFNARLFQSDTIVVKGKIHDYSRATMPHILWFPYQSSALPPAGNGEHTPNCAKVELDGTFSAAFCMDRPCITQIHSIEPRVNIPFYARPGDTIDIQIWNWGAWNQRISYHNSLGHKCYEHLMDLWHFYPNFNDVTDRETTSLAAFMAEADKMEGRMEPLLNYLCWKHHLTPWECHLLKATYCLELDGYYNAILRRIHSRRQNLVRNNLAMLPNDDRFLKDLTWNDSTLLILNAAEGFDDDYIPKQISKAGIHDIRNELDKRLKKSHEFFYTPKDECVKTLIDTIAANSKTPLIQLVLLNPNRGERNEDRITALSDINEMLEENQKIRLVLLINRGTNEQEFRSFENKYLQTFDYITVSEEEFIHLQASLRLVSLPADLTISKEGGVSKGLLFTSFPDNFFKMLHFHLKHLKILG